MKRLCVVHGPLSVAQLLSFRLEDTTRFSGVESNHYSPLTIY
jgi:hypothetical protein